MPGIRIHHPTAKNCALLVHHPGEFKKNFRTHNKGRKAKDYRIVLDNEGNCIVSETIWKRLKETTFNEFIILNEVVDPPAQILGLYEGTFHEPAVLRQMNKALQEIAPPGVKTYVRRSNG